MTKKARTIKAFKALIKKYRNPEGEMFFEYEVCPLCKIHRSEAFFACKGCPLADPDGCIGCTDFRSYEKADDAFFVVGENVNDKKVKRAFEKRAQFFEKYLPVIKKIPARRFTKSGWTYFEELSRKD